MDRDDEREALVREWAALSEEVLSEEVLSEEVLSEEVLSEEVLSGMTDWRAPQPHATLSEIAGALDGRLARMRARLLERAAQQSAVTTWRQLASDQEDAAPRCPQGGTRLEPHGRRTRRVRTAGGQQVPRQREYGVCPQCGQGLFPPG